MALHLEDLVGYEEAEESDEINESCYGEDNSCGDFDEEQEETDVSSESSADDDCGAFSYTTVENCYFPKLKKAGAFAFGSCPIT